MITMFIEYNPKPSFKYHLVDLVALEQHFPLRAFPKQGVHLLSLLTEVAVVHSEVAEQLVVEGLYPEF